MLTLGSRSIARIGLVPGVRIWISAGSISWTCRVSPLPKTTMSPSSLCSAAAGASSCAIAGWVMKAMEQSR
ncbi:MAG: hypothetical protein WDN24_12045 [Sphingomonas sp.]